jgi:transposase-like protein
MLGFKNFMCAEATLVGIELYHMLRKGQNTIKGSLSAWEQFYALAA